jgi:hypothetical protein
VSSSAIAAAALAGGNQFVAFVKSHPGLRMGQINKELGTTTKFWRCRSVAAP